ncbi:MAG TPA: fibronectin type III domain-containing protein, partial [Tepidisphaeraceae bacterium]
MEGLEQRQLLSNTPLLTTAKHTASPAVKKQAALIHPLDASVDTPTTFAATAAGTGEIDLSWDAQTGVDGFVILRGTDNITFGTTLDTSGLDGTATSFNDTTVSPGTKYYYEIEATASAVDSDPSASVNATTPPITPTGLHAAAISAGEIDLTWTAQSGVSGFVIK